MTALALLRQSKLVSTSFCGLIVVVISTAGWAQERFILQPKLREQAVPETKTAQAADPAQQASRQPMAQSVGLSGASTPSQGLKSPLKTVSSSPTGIVVGKGSGGTGLEASAGASLRWVTRGTMDLGDATDVYTQTVDLPKVASIPTQTIDLEREGASGSQQMTANAPLATSTTRMPTYRSDAPPALNAQVALPKPSAAELENVRKQKLASLVSHQILQQRNTSPKQVVAPLDSSPGWQSVGEQMAIRVQACEALLRRNAFYSARAEAEKGMMSLVQVLDGMLNRYHCEPAWAAAKQALKEAEDFVAEQRLSADLQLLQRLIDSHQTPVLKSADVNQLAPMTAAQHYRLYAQTCLEEAAQGHPWASELLYNIGRTYQAQADAADGDAMTHRWRAITFYRAANRADPENALALNQLGFVWLQLDRPLDAKAALIAAVNLRPLPQAMQNLIEAARRLGDDETRRWATSALASMGGAPRAVQPPAVVELSPQAFMAISPRGAGAGGL